MSRQHFNRIGLVGRLQRPHVVETLNAVLDLLKKNGRSIVVERDTRTLMSGSDFDLVDRSDLGECDLVIVVGGDGSILGVARELARTGVQVLGVNRGRLGFLADISPEQIHCGISSVLSGEYRSEVHFLLEQSVIRDEVVVHRSPALNDVVVHSGESSRMLELRLHIDGEYVYQQRSDGIIVSSPTGSTAYALSAGGPIMHPGLEAIAIVPMFPHTLTARPLVVSAESKITIDARSEFGTPKVSADSQIEFSLQPDDRVSIRKYAHGLNLIYPSTHNFYEACRSKLDWGSRLGGQ